MRTAISATVTHDRETWHARVMRPLTGKDYNGRPLRSRATVLALDADSLTMVTRGGSDWNSTAQVHGMSDVEWVDMEHEDVERNERATMTKRREADGWTFYDALDLTDYPHLERLFFTRALPSRE